MKRLIRFIREGSRERMRSPNLKANRCRDISLLTANAAQRENLVLRYENTSGQASHVFYLWPSAHMLSDVGQNPAYTQTHALIQMDCIWLVVMGPSLLKWHQAALGIVHYRAAHVKMRPGKAIKQWFRIHTESNGSTIIWIRATTAEPSRHVFFFATFAGNETTRSVSEPFNSITFSRNVKNCSGPTPTENSVKWICCVKVNGNDSVNKTIWDCMSGCGGSEPQVKETVSLSHCLQRSLRK